MNVSEYPKINKTLFILYVSDQEASMNFYAGVFTIEPTLHVPGMTEFALNEGSSIGLMPEKGIKKLLGEPLPDPQQAAGIPRSEVYLYVEDPESYHQRALAFGGRELRALGVMDWGDSAAYSMDPDGHVLVFARKRESN